MGSMAGLGGLGSISSASLLLVRLGASTTPCLKSLQSSRLLSWAVIPGALCEALCRALASVCPTSKARVHAASELRMQAA